MNSLKIKPMESWLSSLILSIHMLQPSITPVQRIWCLLTPRTPGMCLVHRHACRQNTHEHKIKFKNKIVNKLRWSEAKAPGSQLWGMEQWISPFLIRKPELTALPNTWETEAQRVKGTPGVQSRKQSWLHT